MKGSKVRVPRGWKYWAASSNVFDRPPYCQVVEKGDWYDQKVWDEGRYFLTEGDVKAYVGAERERIKEKLRKRKELQEARRHAEKASRWRRLKELLKR